MTTTDDTGRRSIALLVAVGSLSFVLLGLQIALMRILSYALWYHFASLIIGVALLGFASAGTILSLFRARIVARAGPVVAGAAAICLLASALTPVSLSWIPIDPFLLLSDLGNVFRLFLFISLLVVPFLSGSLVIGLSFVLEGGVIGRFYFANLLGSGIGVIGAVALLELVSPERLPPLLAMVGLAGLWAWSVARRSWIVLASLVTAGVLGLIVHPGPGPALSEFKPLARAQLLPDTRVSERATNPLGVIEILEGPTLRYAPGLSLTFSGTLPSQAVAFHDGELVGPLIPVQDSLIWPVYEHSTSFLPYCLLRPDHVLVVGAGTGSELLLAQRNGSRSMTGLEMNSALVRIFEQRYRSLLPASDAERGMRMIADEGRSYLERDTGTYDLIILPMLEGQTANAAGTQAQFENYLYTVESFSQILRRLKPHGIFVVHAWMNAPPRASAKVLGTMIEALCSAGVRSPGQHLAGVRSWNTVTLAASRQPLTNEQEQSIRRFSRTMGFDLVWLPAMAREETNRFHILDQPYLFDYVDALVVGRGEDYSRQYPFRIAPATDDRPYFSNFISWKDVPNLLNTYRSGEIPYLELGTFFLTGTVIQVLLLSIVVIGLPLVFLVRSGSTARSLGTGVVYFGGLGIGYMIVEMVIIQKAVLFLGDPIYSVAMVVGSLLMFSSLGSRASERLTTVLIVRRWLLPAAVLGLLLLYTLALSPVLVSLLGLPAWARFLVFPALVAPLGFVLGVPFPVGLSRIAHKDPARVPLAWGINGYSSVLAASSAVLVSMELGFSHLQIIALIAYASAFAVFRLGDTGGAW